MYLKPRKNGSTDWKMQLPIQGAANTGALGPMLDAITQTTVSEYVEENPSDLAQYGLANPRYVFDFATSSAKYKLLLGNEKENGSTIYAMLEGRSDVFTINESAYTFLDSL